MAGRAVCRSRQEPPFPSYRMIPDRSSPSRVRFAASRPGRLRADPRGDAERGWMGLVVRLRAVWTGRKGKRSRADGPGEPVSGKLFPGGGLRRPDAWIVGRSSRCCGEASLCGGRPWFRVLVFSSRFDFMISPILPSGWFARYEPDDAGRARHRPRCFRPDW